MTRAYAHPHPAPRGPTGTKGADGQADVDALVAVEMLKNSIRKAGLTERLYADKVMRELNARRLYPDKVMAELKARRGKSAP